MNKLFATLVGSITFLGIITGCRNGKPGTHLPSESTVVSQFEAAGGGNPAAANPDGIALFLGQHPALSRQLLPICSQRQREADANWNQTPEGKICGVASQVVAYRNFYGLDAPAANPPKGATRDNSNPDTRTYGAVPSQR